MSGRGGQEGGERADEHAGAREEAPPDVLVAELRRDLAEAARREEALRRRLLGYEALVDAIPALVFAKDRQHRYTFVNRAFAAWYGRVPEDFVDRTELETHHPATAESYRRHNEQLMATGVGVSNVELLDARPDGTEHWTLETHMPVRDADGAVVGMVGVALDVTEKKRMQEALLRSEAALRDLVAKQKELLERIAELSAPILPVHERVLVLPLVGHVDQERAARMLAALLDAVARRSAAFVILDLTGVPALDADVAARLVAAARAVALLGARCVLTGIAPAIAQGLVTTGADLSALVTRGDLQAGIRYALGHL